MREYSAAQSMTTAGLCAAEPAGLGILLATEEKPKPFPVHRSASARGGSYPRIRNPQASGRCRECEACESDQFRQNVCPRDQPIPCLLRRSIRSQRSTQSRRVASRPMNPPRKRDPLSHQSQSVNFDRCMGESIHDVSGSGRARACVTVSQPCSSGLQDG